ncbi:hypothetical protein [Burkholderia sp. Ac-20344]|uniref:hypothetical protein n=1 Tax=Burkholderia sp. Ac-20344 TaxID=2703890 RepID=UPI00197BF954|nr:hypothetical protein [Burkholderia sp. Ac-20344]MBN3832163.1 hypothetical protein [Burkholderia sp. Ac-20344]
MLGWNDTPSYLITASTGDEASESESGGSACIDALQPLLGDDMRPSPGLPRRLVVAISTNVLQCAAYCVSPSCKPTNVSIWSAYAGESATYTRHPACRYDARHVQLNANTCVGFDAGAISAPRPSEDTGRKSWHVTSRLQRPPLDARRCSC